MCGGLGRERSGPRSCGIAKGLTTGLAGDGDDKVPSMRLKWRGIEVLKLRRTHVGVTREILNQLAQGGRALYTFAFFNPQ